MDLIWLMGEEKNCLVCQSWSRDLDSVSLYRIPIAIPATSLPTCHSEKAPLMYILCYSLNIIEIWFFKNDHIFKNCYDFFKTLVEVSVHYVDQWPSINSLQNYKFPSKFSFRNVGFFLWWISMFHFVRQLKLHIL